MSVYSRIAVLYACLAVIRAPSSERTATRTRMTRPRTTEQHLSRLHRPSFSAPYHRHSVLGARIARRERSFPADWWWHVTRVELEPILLALSSEIRLSKMPPIAFDRSLVGRKKKNILKTQSKRQTLSDERWRFFNSLQERGGQGKCEITRKKMKEEAKNYTLTTLCYKERSFICIICWFFFFAVSVCRIYRLPIWQCHARRRLTWSGR